MKRNEFQQKWQEQIDQLTARIDELRARAAGATAEVREEMAERIRSLEGQREKARVKLKELLEEGEDVWEEVAEEAEEMFGRLKTSVEGLLSRFRTRHEE